MIVAKFGGLIFEKILNIANFDFFITFVLVFNFFLLIDFVKNFLLNFFFVFLFFFLFLKDLIFDLFLVP